MSRPALRAPTTQYGLLAVPPLTEAAAVVDHNAGVWHKSQVRLFDTPLAQLRDLAQQETLAEATAFMTRIGMPVPSSAGQGYLVTGHQPELSHPGVWIKNFAAHALAHRLGRRSLNIIVDSDLVKANSIRVPNSQGERHPAEFDSGPLAIPFEERHVEDESTFRCFPETVTGFLGDVPWRPMLPEFWPLVTAAAAQTPRLGERFSAGRHRWEIQQGCENLEVPISRLSGSAAFAHFALDLLAQLPRFHLVHNESLDAFRRKHRIRSRHHPVPALAESEGWREVPFWAWRAAQPRRGRLFAQETPGGWRLAVLGPPWHVLEHFIPRETAEAVAAWRALGSQGWKVRSRALTTTLFARLLLADLFIHGIGGGIYDELTDAIVERYYGLTPPAFLVLSATLRLPWRGDRPNVPPPGELQRQLRNLDYHPELFLGTGTDGTAVLQQEKQRWLARQPSTKPEKYERFLALKQITAALSEHLADQKRRVEVELDHARHSERGAKWRQDREYAFCLFPTEELQKLMARVHS